MRQLEMLLGEAALRDGLREYLKRYAFGNATWLDLVRVLDARTPENLAAWSRAWVEERGRPRVRRPTPVDAEARIAALTLTMSAIRWVAAWSGRSGCEWRSVTGTVRVLAGGRRRGRRRGRRGRAAACERPLYVLPNGGGLGYGSVPPGRIPAGTICWRTSRTSPMP